MLSFREGRPLTAVALFVLIAAGLWGQPDALAQKSQQVKQLMSAGRFAEAIPLCEELVRALPSNPGLRLNLALAYQMAGRQRDAIPEFERVLKADPANQPALMSLGVSYLEVNEPAKAVAPLQKVVASQPENVDIRGMLANALLSLGRAKEAAPHFRKLTALTPGDAKAWYGLGRTYETLAQQAFENLSRTGEGSAEWLALVADSRMEARQYRSAFYFYKEALAKDPNLPGLHAALAEVYRRTEHPDWAGAEARKETKPNCTAAKAACDYAAGRYLDAAAGASSYWRARAYNELALEAFTKLGGLPESVEMHALKAQIATSHNQHLEAANEWRAAERLAPGDPRIRREIAAALYQAQDYKTAAPMLESLIREQPDAADLHFFLGDSLLHMEQAEQAVPELAAAVRLDPKLLPARAALGLTYVRLNKPAEAIPQLEAAIAMDDDGSLHYQLARAYQRSGNAEQAKTAMQKYQEIQQRSEAEKAKLEQEAKITPP